MNVDVTIVHVPRERFGATQRSLESVLAHSADTPHKLLVLDADSPPATADFLRAAVAAHDDAELLRFDFAMTPNELRNEAIKRVDTPYIAFVDNDAVVTPGWLAPLLASAREHDAWVVGPTMLIGEPEDGRIHLAGGDCEVRDADGKRQFSYLVQHHSNDTLDDVGSSLAPGPCTCIEFHCMLVATKTFDAIGLLNEKLMSFVECDDFSMEVTKAGGLIYFEPKSIVTYLVPKGRMEAPDLEFFLLRWSDEWNETSLRTFVQKYELDPDHKWVRHARSWPKQHRRFALRNVASPLGRLCEIIQYRVSYRLGDRLAGSLEGLVTRRVRARRALGLARRNAG